MIPIDTAAVSGVAISEVDGKAKILLMKRTKGDFWSHFAGSIEGAEKGWEAIIREFKEETQIEVECLFKADYIEQFYESQSDRIALMPAFVVLCMPNQPVSLNSEHTAYKWCTLQEAISLAAFPNQKELYSHIWKYFIEQQPSETLAVKLSVSIQVL